MRKRVFGIGLSRTGTSSLSSFLTSLGLRTVHHPRGLYGSFLRGDYRLAGFEAFDAFTDAPIAFAFPQLDACFPGAKFIATYRPVDEWLESIAGYWRIRDPEWERRGVMSTVNSWRSLVYGVTEFNADRLKYVYHRHYREVAFHFRNRASDLYWLRLESAVSPVRIADFLGIETDNLHEFPHLNSLRDVPGYPH